MGPMPTNLLGAEAKSDEETEKESNAHINPDEEPPQESGKPGQDRRRSKGKMSKIFSIISTRQRLVASYQNSLAPLTGQAHSC